MPRPRLDTVQQAAILDATVRVIAQRGADRTRLVDVAHAVGRSTGTLQHYFGSRDELFAAAFRRLNELSAEHGRTAAAEIADPWARLQSVLDAIFGSESDRGEWRIWLEFWAAWARDPELRALTGDVYATWRELLVEAIHDGEEAGDFAPTERPEVVAAALLAAVDGTALHSVLGIGGLDHATARSIVTAIAAGYLRLVDHAT